jgi:Cu+-exporting ATPase
MLRIFSTKGLYLRNAASIESMAEINHVVFDKTGTLTQASEQELSWHGVPLPEVAKEAIGQLTAQSTHPLSQVLRQQYEPKSGYTLESFEEIPGQGLKARLEGREWKLGSVDFVKGAKDGNQATRVFLSADGDVFGYFQFSNQYRKELPALLRELKPGFRISVLSGDNAAEKNNLQALMGTEATLLFDQKPIDKLHYIEQLQQRGEKVMMVGDGLNDAGALKQADLGMAISEQKNNFTPASDAIIEAARLPLLQRFIRLARANKKIVMASFVLSIVYNIIGLFFAVQGTLSPLIAAILMPSSSISIVLLTFGASGVAGKRIVVRST